MLRVDGFQAIRATRPDHNLTWQLIKKKIGFLFFFAFFDTNQLFIVQSIRVWYCFEIYYQLQENS